MTAPISTQRVLLIGISAVAFGISTLLRKISVETLHPFQFQIVAGLLYGILAIPWFFAAKGAGATQSWDLMGIFWCITCSIVATIGAVVLMYALRSGHDTGIVATLSGVSPIITVMLASLFLGEQPNLKQGIGMLLVVGGVIIASGR